MDRRETGSLPLPTTVADIVKAVSAGRMGNHSAIEALQLHNYDELVDTVQLND